MKQRVIVDTSTLVSAALRMGSTPRLALKTALEQFDLCLCEGTLSELETVLARPKFLRYASAEALRAFVESIRAEGSMFLVGEADLEVVEPPCRDATDNIVLALAQASKAVMIVSSDQDLLVLNPWRGIPILTPAQFVTQFPL